MSKVYNSFQAYHLTTRLHPDGSNYTSNKLLKKKCPNPLHKGHQQQKEEKRPKGEGAVRSREKKEGEREKQGRCQEERECKRERKMKEGKTVVHTKGNAIRDIKLPLLVTSKGHSKRGSSKIIKGEGRPKKRRLLEELLLQLLLQLLQPH